MSNLSSLITQTVGSSAGGVNLITAPSSASIWTATGGVTVTTTTTAAELPLEGFSSTAVKFALSASTGTAYCDFDCPTALQNFLLQLLWYSRASSGFTASITLSINSYSSSGNRTSNTSPTVVTPQVSAIVGAGINFETNFLSTSNQYLRLTLSFGAQASAWYSIAQFGIGPSNRTQGPAFTDVTLTPTVIGATNGLAFTNTTVSNCIGLRVGSWLEVTGKLSFTGLPATGTGALVVRLSTSGLTLDSTKSQNWNGSGAFYDSSTANIYNLSPAPYMTSTNLDMQFSLSGETGTNLTLNPASVPVAFASGDLLNFSVRIPIAEWSSSALNLGPGAQVEYAYNSSTTNTTDTTSFAFGPNGGALISSNPAGGGCTKQVRFQYPIQSDDLIIVEVSPNGDGKWFSIPAMDSSANPMESLHQEATDYFGLGIYQTSGLPATDVALKFGHYPGSHFTDTTGYNWSSYSTWRYRVRKAKASSPVGFGLANVDGSAGLYKPGSAPGLATGAAISAGYVGQILTASLSNVSFTVSGTGYNLGQLTLTAGVWMVYSQMYCNAPGGSSKSLTAISLSPTAAFTSQYSVNSSSTAVSAQESLFIARPFTTDGATNNIAYCYGFMSYSGGAPATTAANSAMWAVRIG